MTYSFLRKYFKDHDYDKYKFDFEHVTKLYGDLLLELENKELVNESEKYWNNKHTKKDVYYLGRRLITANTDSIITCDIKNFITPNDASIKDLVSNNNLKIVDINVCDKQVMDIYRFCRKDAKYSYDNTLFGKNEVWLFPFEFLYLNKNGDCEDNSHYIASMLICAGVPAFRVRVVCGMCKWGGHSTVYVLGDDLTTWHHINSTGGMEDNVSLSDCPTRDSATDDFGITDVWFSFNNIYSFSDFETINTAATFNKELGDKIKIV